MCALILFALLSTPMVSPAQTPPGGYVVQHEEQIATIEPGPHNGPGQTVGYSFFKDAGLRFVFRKRILKPGSGIGHHLQTEDEIYYVLSGRGVMTIDGRAFDVAPGTAVLTRPGSSHSLKQAGVENLVIFISYEEARPMAR